MADENPEKSEEEPFVAFHYNGKLKWGRLKKEKKKFHSMVVEGEWISVNLFF